MGNIVRDSGLYGQYCERLRGIWALLGLTHINIIISINELLSVTCNKSSVFLCVSVFHAE